MEKENPLESKVEIIKGAIEENLGKVFDEKTGRVKQRKFDNIILTNRCGDVSKITNEIIQGEVKTFTAQGKNPAIFYEHGGSSLEIASAHDTAHHAYVVDGEQNVWDPITRIWGSMGEKGYLSRLKIGSEG
jgi:hypothetical protein